MSTAEPHAKSPPTEPGLNDGDTSRVAFPLWKRAFDVTFSLIGILLLAPFAVLVALAIKLSDRGPIYYRQRRVGLHGKIFEILKFRTMVVGAEKMGPSVTQDEDPRITRVGRFLRKTKLDELPQLWNVLNGTMSFVGPRPEVPRYVDRYTPEQRQLLDYKPGITDLATLVFRDEEALLRGAEDVEEFYVNHCIPRKFHLNLQYARRANLIEDVLIIAETLCPYWLSVVCTYLLALSFSLWLSYQLRFDFSVPPEELVNLKKSGLLIVPLQLVLLSWRKQFVGLLSYFDLHEIKQLATGLGLSGLMMSVLWFATNGKWIPGRSIVMMDCIVAFMVIGGTRLVLRMIRESQAIKGRQRTPDEATLRVGIVGAGELGLWLVEELNFRFVGGRRVEALFDDDPDKWHKELQGVEVVGMPECILDGSWGGKLDEVIIAMPGAKPDRIQQIRSILASANIRARTMPSLERILAEYDE